MFVYSYSKGNLWCVAAGVGAAKTPPDLDKIPSSEWSCCSKGMFTVTLVFCLFCLFFKIIHVIIINIIHMITMVIVE